MRPRRTCSVASRPSPIPPGSTSSAATPPVSKGQGPETGRDQSRTCGEPEQSGGIRVRESGGRISATPSKSLKLTPDNDLSYILLVNRGMAFDSSGIRPIKPPPTSLRPSASRKIRTPTPTSPTSMKKQGKIDEAIAQFSQAIALKPEWAALYRGRAELMQDRPDSTPEHRAAALADLKMAIVKEKDDRSVLALDHTNVGKLFYADERFADALEESRLALEINSVYVEAQVLQVQVLLKLRRYDEVIYACDKAIGLGKKSAVLYELRGLAQAARTEYAAAISDYSRALEIQPKNGKVLVHRGWAYLMFDSPKPALVDFEAAVKLDPKDPRALQAEEWPTRGSAITAPQCPTHARHTNSESRTPA